MSNIFEDKPRRIEIHKSLKPRLILTSRKRLKLEKIKKIKKIKKKFHRISKKIRNHEKYEENNINKNKEEETIFNKSYPNILKEKENVNENHFIYKPKQKSNNIIIIETNDEGEPRIINNNIKNEPIKNVEDNHLIHSILNIKDNNSQQDSINTNNNIPNLSNNNRNNSNFDGFVPCEFTYGNLIEQFEGNSFSDDFTSHDSPFIPRTLNFNLDNNFNELNLFSNCQDIFRFNNDKADDYSHFSIPDTFSFNSSKNQNNIPNSNFNSNNSNLLNNRNNNFLNNNFNNDYIYRNNNSYRHHLNYNNLNYSYNIFNYNINNNIFNRNHIILSRNNNNIFNNINIYCPNAGINSNFNNNIIFNNRNNNNLNNNRSNNSNNNNDNSNILNRIRNRYYYPNERSLSYYGVGKIKINKIKEKLSKNKIKNINNLEDNKKNCIICLEEFKNRQMIYTLPCQHIFHVNCLNKEIKLRQKCPICRKELK